MPLQSHGTVLDHTGLFYRCLARFTLDFYNEKNCGGLKEEKTRAKFLVYFNADKSDKETLTFIGNCDNPRALHDIVLRLSNDDKKADIVRNYGVKQTV